MCYEFSWFQKARSRELNKGQEKTAAEKRPPATAPTRQPERAHERATETDKIPA